MANSAQFKPGRIQADKMQLRRELAKSPMVKAVHIDSVIPSSPLITWPSSMWFCYVPIFEPKAKLITVYGRFTSRRHDKQITGLPGSINFQPETHWSAHTGPWLDPARILSHGLSTSRPTESNQGPSERTLDTHHGRPNPRMAVGSS